MLRGETNLNRIFRPSRDIRNGHELGAERYAYCLCLHVRPASVFIGVINLGGALIYGIMFLALLPYHKNEFGTSPHASAHQSTATALGIIIYMMLASVSAMLIYGALKSKPSYLMPFFGIQLCDFFFTLPAFLTSLYSPAGHHYTSTSQQHGWNSAAASGMVSASTSTGSFMDVRRLWPNASPSTVYTGSLLVTTCIILFKAYFLCVVWKCYRYLKIRELTLPLTFHHHHHHPTIHPPHTANLTGLEGIPYMGTGGAPELVVPPMVVPPPSAAPPDYDTATKSCPPPDYESAVKNSEFKFDMPSSATASPQPLHHQAASFQSQGETESQRHVPMANQGLSGIAQDPQQIEESAHPLNPPMPK